jgi:hypothetical protein
MRDAVDAGGDQLMVDVRGQPEPPAAFSALATTNRACSSPQPREGLGQQIWRPGLPTMSPMKKIRMGKGLGLVFD